MWLYLVTTAIAAPPSATDYVLETGPTDPQAPMQEPRGKPNVLRPGPPGIHQVWYGDYLITTAERSPKAITAAWGRVYVLHDDDVLETWRFSGQQDRYELTSRVLYPGAADVTTGAGRVWVLVTETRAVAVDQVNVVATDRGFTIAPDIGTGTVKAENLGVESNRVTRTSGHVLFTDVGEAIVDLGEYDGLEEGDRVVFWTQESQRTTSMWAAGKQPEERRVRRRTASGTIEVIDLRKALVRIDRGGRVHEGDSVERTRTPPGANLVAPARLGSIGETALVLRPLLGLETLGGGAVSEAWARYGFSGPGYVSARLMPLALGVADGDLPASFGAGLTGGFDGNLFSVGIGAGWSTVEGRPATAEVEDLTGLETRDSAFAILAESRVGARDGLHLEARGNFALAPTLNYTWNGQCTGEPGSTNQAACYDLEPVDQQFVLSQLAGRLSIPTSRQTDGFLDGGTGALGTNWAMAGVRTWLRGTGDRGSLALELSAGAGSLRDGDTELLGPMIGGGFISRW